VNICVAHHGEVSWTWTGQVLAEQAESNARTLMVSTTSVCTLGYEESLACAVIRL
jgi:hypothetical protein